MTFKFDSVGETATLRPLANSNAVAVGDPTGAEPRCRLVLVGNPNVGKSVIFGALTGTYVTVSNYPGTTVEITRGRATFNNGQPGQVSWEVVDTPGAHNLVPMSEDEVVTRDILLSSQHDAIVQVGDAKNLSRTLLLTLQLAELGIPFVLNLNMMDEARARGIAIDLAALEGELSGICVNTSAAIAGEGLDGLRARLAVIDKSTATSGRDPLPCALTYPDDVEEAIAAIAKELPATFGAPRAASILLLSGNRDEDGWLVERAESRAREVSNEYAQALEEKHGIPVFALLSKLRLTRAQAIVRAVQRRTATRTAAANGERTHYGAALAGACGASAIVAFIYDGGLGLISRGATPEELDDYGFFTVAGRIFSRDIFRGWHLSTLLVLSIAAILTTALARRNADLRSSLWKAAGAFAAGYSAYWIAAACEGVMAPRASAIPFYVGAGVGLSILAIFACLGDRHDAPLSSKIGHLSTHRLWGIPILVAVLFFAYKIVGVFGAGTAVDFLENKVFGGLINPRLQSVFEWIGVPFVTDFFVGRYGLVTMGVTYAVAIVLPVVATFFFVFSIMEDSGYLPRLAVMANRNLRAIGLNGKAVLPMILGLGCDTMATLTARIMETKKERVLVTLLLALGIPCSAQLSVIFALMQRTSKLASVVWVMVVLLTIGIVGYVSAKVIPGERSEFLLEMPPIRRPMLGNLVTKTMARIEWYLREAAPLFLFGTVFLFALDRLNWLVFVHKAGEPVVHHILGFVRENGVSDRVSEALLIGFLRRDFGAAGLLDMAREGQLTPSDIAVSMVTITLFIPCIANVFMIVKERGWKVAAMMSAFIFPYAVIVGALVRLLFRSLGVA